MNNLFKSICFLSVIFTQACTENTSKSASDISVTTQLEPFSAINLTGRYHVVLVKSPIYSLTTQTKDSFLSSIQSDIKKNTLQVNMKLSQISTQYHTPKLTITCPMIDTIQLAGKVTIEAKDIYQESLDIINQGSGKLILSGNIHHVNIHSYGLLKFYGQKLQTVHTKISAHGINKIFIHAYSTLGINTNGYNKIYYKGSPKVTKNTIGYSDIQPYKRENNTKKIG